MQLPLNLIQELERISYPHFGYYHNHMLAARNVGVVNFRNRRYYGLDVFLNVAEDRALNPPPHVRAAQAMAMTVSNNEYLMPRGYVPADASMAEKAVAIFEDGLGYYNLKRLTQKQKNFVYGWVEDAIQAHTRSPHEQATVMIEVFSGQRSSLKNIYTLDGSSKPFKPTLGAFKMTHERLTYTIHLLKKLGAFENYDTDSLATSVMKKAGCDTDEFSKSTRMRKAMKYAASIEKLVRWMKELDQAIHGYLPSKVDMNELVEAIAISKQGEYQYNPLRNAVNDVNQYAAWLRLNQDVYKDDTELDFFVDEVMKRLVARIKNRG